MSNRPRIHRPRKKLTRGPGRSVTLRKLGRAVQLAYRVPGESETRLHEFGPGVTVEASTDGTLLVIAGGKMKFSKGYIRG